MPVIGFRCQSSVIRSQSSVFCSNAGTAKRAAARTRRVRVPIALCNVKFVGEKMWVTVGKQQRGFLGGGAERLSLLPPGHRLRPLPKAPRQAKHYPYRFVPESWAAHPGGMRAPGRARNERIPGVHQPNGIRPEGRRWRENFSRHLRGASVDGGVFRWLRSCLASPPANFSHPFGMADSHSGSQKMWVMLGLQCRTLQERKRPTVRIAVQCSQESLTFIHAS